MRRREPFRGQGGVDTKDQIAKQFGHIARNLAAPVTLHKAIVGDTTVIAADERVQLLGPITIAPNRTLTIRAGGVVRVV